MQSMWPSTPMGRRAPLSSRCGRSCMSMRSLELVLCLLSALALASALALPTSSPGISSLPPPLPKSSSSSSEASLAAAKVTTDPSRLAASDAGRPIRKVVVVGGTHGNEYTGVWCIKAMEAARADASHPSNVDTLYPTLDVSTLLGNPVAHAANRRFVHTDLNREFSAARLLAGLDTDDENDDDKDDDRANGKLERTVESIRAREIDAVLGPKFHPGHGADVVIDLHTTTSNMGTTLIIPEGDALMAQTAAHVLHRCGGEEHGKARVLVHTIPKREHRPNLSSAGRHGLTVEVGPVPQGVLRHDAIERTQQAVSAALDFLHRRNVEGHDAALNRLRSWYGSDHTLDGREVRVPCYRSAPARVNGGQLSGKIAWPSDPTNPNFPGAVVHKSLQDKDFALIRKGDPLFLNLDGSVQLYDGSHGDAVHLMFINEGGYYYESSGTGIGVAVKAEYRLDNGMMVHIGVTKDENNHNDVPPKAVNGINGANGVVGSGGGMGGSRQGTGANENARTNGSTMEYTDETRSSLSSSSSSSMGVRRSKNGWRACDPAVDEECEIGRTTCAE